jgi:3-phytase
MSMTATQDDRFLGAFRIQANGADVVQGPSGLFALRAPVGAGLPAGALLVTDDRKVGPTPRSCRGPTSPPP